jgi:hypothetical protein
MSPTGFSALVKGPVGEEPESGLPAVTLADFPEFDSSIIRDSLVLVEGPRSAGSGFLVRVGGEPYLYSNAHVLSAERNLKLRSQAGAAIRVGEAEAALGHDIVRFELPNEAAQLEAALDAEELVKVGDPVVVLGNEEGAGVVTELTGRVVGIGHDRIEVDAEFLPGNSGSPIIHLPSGKVIAIATYIKRRDFETVRSEAMKGEGERTEWGIDAYRRFGYRLDSVEDWQPVQWNVFYEDAASLAQVEKVTKDLFVFMLDVQDDGFLAPHLYSTDDVRNPVRNYVERTSGAARLSQQKRLFAYLRSATQRDIKSSGGAVRYDYFITRMKEEAQVREQFFEFFDEWINTH